jgi:ketosteroid isomerase-like protein
MPRTCILILAVAAPLLATANFNRNAYAHQNKAEQELIQIEHDWCAALVKKDAAFLARTLADDYTLIGSRGTPSTKAEELANLKGTDSMTSCVDSNFKVRIYGDAAVVTGLATRSGTHKGVAFKDRQSLFTDTFIKKDGRWQCVASQGTVVAAQQK